jgi:hypothetical protein
VRLTTPPHKKILLQDLKRRPMPTQGCRADDDDYYYFLSAVAFLIRKVLNKSSVLCETSCIANRICVLSWRRNSLNLRDQRVIDHITAVRTAKSKDW